VGWVVGMGTIGIGGGGATAFPFLFFGRLPCGSPSAVVACTSPPKGGGVACAASRASGGVASSVEGGSGGGSSSNQGVECTVSPLEGDCVGGGPARGVVVLCVAPRDTEREPMRSIIARRVLGEAVPVAEAAWMHRDRDLVRTLSCST